MKQIDDEKTSFTTPFGTYCYVRMPEGLYNTGSTFNRTVKAVLGTQLGKNYMHMLMILSSEARSARIIFRTFARPSQISSSTGSN
jgi:hypothetical protein